MGVHWRAQLFENLNEHYNRGMYHRRILSNKTAAYNDELQSASVNCDVNI